MLVSRDSLETYLLYACQTQLLSAYALYLAPKNNIIRKLTRGTPLFLGLIASSYAFSKLDIEQNKELKLATFFATHICWGSLVCRLMMKFIPQAKLGLLLPMSIFSFLYYSIGLHLSYRKESPVAADKDKVIDWYYPNETLFIGGTILAQLGIMSGLGLLMMNRRFRIAKDDWK